MNARLQACAEAGERDAKLQQDSTKIALDPSGQWLGKDSTWDERRAYEWGYLSVRCPYYADYCKSRIAALVG